MLKIWVTSSYIQFGLWPGLLKNSHKTHWYCRFDKNHFDRRSILRVKFNFYKKFFSDYRVITNWSQLFPFTWAKCIGSPPSSMMIVLYSGVSCERPDRATAAMATWTDDVYLLDCWAVSFRLLFDNSSIASIQFPRWLLHGTKPLGMIYSLVLCTPDFFMCHFEHIFFKTLLYGRHVFSFQIQITAFGRLELLTPLKCPSQLTAVIWGEGSFYTNRVTALQSTTT